MQAPQSQPQSPMTYRIQPQTSFRRQLSLVFDRPVEQECGREFGHVLQVSNAGRIHCLLCGAEWIASGF